MNKKSQAASTLQQPSEWLEAMQEWPESQDHDLIIVFHAVLRLFRQISIILISLSWKQ